MIAVTAPDAPYYGTYDLARAGDTTYATPMRIMHAAIRERAYERLCEYDVTLSSAAPFFNVTEYPGNLFLGSFAWTDTGRKLKWLALSHAQDIGAGVWVTPGDIARDYLGLKYPDRRQRLMGEQMRLCVEADYSPPRFAQPCAMYDGCTYFDLTGAYWQIVRAVGWDVDYLPGSFLGVNSSMTDFPFRDQKLARNCLVSIGTASQMTIWNGEKGKLYYRKTGNKFINHVLWRLVCDVLQGIAVEVMKAGAKYVFTDGYIVSGTDAANVADVLDSWGVRYDVRHWGAWGQIRAPASYRVGDFMTKPYRDSKRTQAFSNLYDPNIKWLKPRWLAFVEQANRDWLFFKGLDGYDD